MTSIAEAAAIIEHVLGEVAEQAGRATGFVQRRSKLGGRVFVQTLVLGWLQQPAATLQQLTQTAAGLGVTITPQGLEQRFTAAAAALLRQVLEAAVAHVIQAEPVPIAVLERFSAVLVQDSTTITLPEALAAEWAGCGNGQGQGTAALKVQVRWDLLRGGLDGLFLEPGRAADQRAAVQTVPLPAGALRIGDLGYFSLDVFATTAAQGSYWLSRLFEPTAVYTAAGQPLDLVRWLPRQGAVVDCPIQLGQRHRLPARLLAVRVPPPVAAVRRGRLRALAQEKGRRVSSRSWTLAAWTLLVTNCPPARLAVDEALVLYRARWQIELLFKRWKQGGLVDEWRSAQPWRILCEVYAKLLGEVLVHWGCVLGGWGPPDRSWVQAGQAVRGLAPLLGAALAGLLPLTAVLTHLQQILAHTARLNPRRRAPNTYQLLLHPPPLPLYLAEVA